MRIDELPTSDRIEDRRGGPSRFPGGRGGIGIGTIVVLGLIGWALGIDPRVLIQGAEECHRVAERNSKLTLAQRPAPERRGSEGSG